MSLTISAFVGAWGKIPGKTLQGGYYSSANPSPPPVSKHTTKNCLVSEECIIAANVDNNIPLIFVSVIKVRVATPPGYLSKKRFSCLCPPCEWAPNSRVRTACKIDATSVHKLNTHKILETGMFQRPQVSALCGPGKSLAASSQDKRDLFGE